MITTTLVLSIVTAVASAVAAYFLGRMDGAESTRARYSSIMSNLNSELENLISSVKTEAGTPVATPTTEPVGKGTEVTELPKTKARFAHLVVPEGVDDTLGGVKEDYKDYASWHEDNISGPKPKKAKAPSEKKQTPKRKKGKK